MTAFREMLPRDRRFVVDAWARSYQRANTAGLIALEDWFAVMIPQINKALDRRDVTTVVAYDPRTPSPADLYGFATADVTGDVPIVFYVFVKEPYRKQGIARGMLAALHVDPEGLLWHVCDTPIVGILRRAGKLQLAKWRPLLGRVSTEERKQECPQTKPRRSLPW